VSRVLLLSDDKSLAKTLSGRIGAFVEEK
jgi:hypothetical protein